MQITKVELPDNIVIGDRCSTVLLADKSKFYVAGGNDDFKEFYDVFYEFDTKDPSTPRILENLPMKL